jgi:eukaryotic-like serine/threonine-protein kinase
MENPGLEPLTNATPTIDSHSPPVVVSFERPGTLIGPYKILHTLGRGGMGVVCRAEQQFPVKRQVALKITRAGMDSDQAILRFEAERQALALMDHPHIARVLDAGATETGRLYFVMELVEGVPITRYCDSAGLGIPERLELLIFVCHAIQHAHQKGIIHRDIKPSNILVALYDGKPAPKVIDFGIAKAVDSGTHRFGEGEGLTQVGAIVGTIEYMSPEQAGSGAAAVDTRSDIYSLGVLLYELLTGVTPLDRASLRGAPEHEALRLIREQVPRRPSSRIALPRKAREVRGDLDWIVLRALETDPNRRYATVGALAADIRRHLDGEPVEACPPSAAYRIGKFARRHRAPLAAAVAFFVLLAAAAVFIVAQTFRARLAEAEATAVKNFLQDDLLAQASVRRQAHRGSVPDPDLKVRTALDRAAVRVAGKFASQPGVEASVRATIGTAYLDLRLDGPAQEQLERATELYRRVRGTPSPDGVAALESLEHVYALQGKPERAAPVAAEAVDARRALNGPEAAETLLALSRLAVDEAYLGKTLETGRLIDRALATARRKFGPEHAVTAQILANAGQVAFAQERWPDAATLYAEALAIRRRRLGSDDPDTLDSMTDLSTTYHRLQSFKEGETLEREIVAVRRRVLGAEHPDTLASMANLSVDLNRQGRFAEAEQIDLEILAIRRRVLGPEHPTTLQNMFNLALNYLRQGRFAEAEALDAQTFEARKRVLGPDHVDTLRSLNDLAADYRWDGKLAQAERLTVTLCDQTKRALGPEHNDSRGCISELGKVYRAKGDFARAAEYSRRSMNLSIQEHGPEHTSPQRHRSDFAFDLARQGKYAEAEPEARAALDIMRRANGLRNRYTLLSAAVLVDVWHALGRDAQAETLARESLAAARETLPGGWQEAQWKALLGVTLTGQGRRREAMPLLLAGYDGMLRLVTSMDAPERFYLRMAAEWIAQSYAASRRPEEAAAWRRKAAAH